eukprot:m.258733 g.258733  ORF g.258733 m.258733 type:complete len:854 (-) comp16195_c0_seq1:114-2675(-)
MMGEFAPFVTLLLLCTSIVVVQASLCPEWELFHTPCDTGVDRKSCLEAMLLETEGYSEHSDCDELDSTRCYIGNRTYNELVLACNRKRDSNGIGKRLNNQFIDEHRFENDLPLKIIRGSFQYFGFFNKMYHYLLERAQGVWTITSVMEFEWPLADKDFLHINLELARNLSRTNDNSSVDLTAPGEICSGDVPERLVSQDGSSYILGCRVERNAEFFPLDDARTYRMPGSPDDKRLITDWVMLYWRDQIELRWSRPGHVNMKIDLVKFAGLPGEISTSLLQRVRDADAVYRVDLHHNYNRDNNMFRPIHIFGIDIYPGIYAARYGELISHEFGHSLGLDDEYPQRSSDKVSIFLECDKLNGQNLRSAMRYLMCRTTDPLPKSIYFYIVTQRYGVMGVCDTDADCMESEFCANKRFNWFRPSERQCTEKKSLGSPCTRDEVCKSGVCPIHAGVGYCSECAEGLRDENDHPCPDEGEYCDKGGFAGFGANTCVPKKANGESCSRPDQCLSGMCPFGIASKCAACTEDTHCGNGKYCNKFGENTCEDQRLEGEVCSRAAQCSSNCCKLFNFKVQCRPAEKCGENQCSEDGECPSDEFCDKVGTNVCTGKRDVGESCTRDRQCQSGKCPSGVLTKCAECLEDSHCGSSEYCDTSGVNTCEAKRANGVSCTQDRQCQSGMCPFGIGAKCAECLADNDCSSGDYCDKSGVNTCERQKDSGVSCSRDAVCKSSCCKLYNLRMQCRPSDRCDECAVDGDCASTQYCDKVGTNKCKNKKFVGESCSRDEHCKSDMCPSGIATKCAECLADSDCSSTTYCHKSGVNTCERKRSQGDVCSRGEQCYSNCCKLFSFKVQCRPSDKC